MYVELLGIPRERAGVSDLELEARTLGQVFDSLTARFPRLAELLPEVRITRRR
jgi:molybdopterin converting factor small subunit